MIVFSRIKESDANETMAIHPVISFFFFFASMPKKQNTKRISVYEEDGVSVYGDTRAMLMGHCEPQ